MEIDIHIYDNKDLVVISKRQHYVFDRLLRFFKNATVFAVCAFCVTVLLIYYKHHGVTSNKDGILKVLDKITIIIEQRNLLKGTSIDDDLSILPSVAKIDEETHQVGSVYNLNAQKAVEKMKANVKANDDMQMAETIEEKAEIRKHFLLENTEIERATEIMDGVIKKAKNNSEVKKKEHQSLLRIKKEMIDIYYIYDVIPVKEEDPYYKYYFKFMASAKLAFEEGEPEPIVVAFLYGISMLTMWVFGISALLFVPSFIFFIHKSFERFPGTRTRSFRRFQFYAANVLPFVIFSFVVTKENKLDPKSLVFLQNADFFTLLFGAIVVSCLIWTVNEFIPITFRFSLLSFVLCFSLFLLFKGIPVALYVMIFGILLYCTFGINQMEKVVRHSVAYDLEPRTDAHVPTINNID
ncbi:hypothetical protein [Candidatus Uabimicrobium amorphum]|uniref:Uncharacterized protein n=1 Tax=Uabimicrobium amorphum TaxID=2596890 RepID=A0A5S9F605_UABAM|nr:hypothetical protein [Candidatus Uabimicrobium amorphum]BBM86673.1 hypothetical protein UABAM_05059 [Candidatus Uabimicrobium amorphum]